MTLVALPAFSDNIIWMLHDGERAWVIDPGDAVPVETALVAHSLQLAGILVTHKHEDHIGGIEALAPRLKATGGEVIVPAHEPLPLPHSLPLRPVWGGEVLQLGAYTARVFDTPGHTLGHNTYFVTEPSAADAPLLFCGDTLFSAGCGRLFEGTPAQMLAALDQFSDLPDNTRVCCAHEYTLSNLRFALAVEPGNNHTLAHRELAQSLRLQERLTLPSTLGLERLINPFLRCDQVDVQVAAQQSGFSMPSTETASLRTQTFAALRAWKNQFQ